MRSFLYRANIRRAVELNSLHTVCDLALFSRVLTGNLVTSNTGVSLYIRHIFTNDSPAITVGQTHEPDFLLIQAVQQRFKIRSASLDSLLDRHDPGECLVYGYKALIVDRPQAAKDVGEVNTSVVPKPRVIK